MATPVDTLSDHAGGRESPAELLAHILPEPSIDSSGLTENEKAALRTESRRAIVQELRARIREIKGELTHELRAAREKAKHLTIQSEQFVWKSALDYIPENAIKFMFSDAPPSPPTRRFNQPPTTQQLYEYLAAHAEWESRTLRSTRQLVRRARERMETVAKAKAIEKIWQAVHEAIDNTPTARPALRRDLMEIGTIAIRKVIGPGAKATPTLSLMQRTASDEPYTDEQIEHNRHAWLVAFAARMHADASARFGAYQPPASDTPATSADIVNLMDHPVTATKVAGRWVSTDTADTAVAIAFARSQGGQNHA